MWPDRHAERFLARRHQLGQQPDVLGPHDLGQHQCRHARHHRRGDVGDGQFERAIDAHHDVGAVLGDPRHRGRQRLARGFLVRGNDRVLEIEDQRVGAARVRLGEEALDKDRDEQQRSPGRQGPRHAGWDYSLKPAGGSQGFVPNSPGVDTSRISISSDVRISLCRR